MARAPEYLEQALAETVAAARWYAERSPTAAAAFSEEIDEAESAIVRLPEAWPPFGHGTADTFFAAFRSASSIEWNPSAS